MVHPIRKSGCEGSNRRAKGKGPSEDRHSIEDLKRKKKFGLLFYLSTKLKEEFIEQIR